MTFAKSAAWLGGAQALNLILTLVIRVVLARLLGAASFGAFGAALSAATLLSRSLSLGSATASQVFASQPGRDRGAVIGASLLLSVCIGLVATVVGFTLLHPIQSTFLANHPEGGATLALLVAFLPVIVVGMNLGVMLIPFRQVRAYSALQVVASSAFLIPCAALTPLLPPLQAAAWAQASVWVAMLAVTAWLLRGEAKNIRIDLGLALEMLRFGLRAWPNVCLSIGLASSATLFGALFLSPVELSLFVLAINLAEGVFAPHASVGQLLLTKSASDSKRALEVTALLLRLSWVGFAAVTALFAATGWWLIPVIFGQAFAGAYAAAVALLVGGAAHAVTRTLGNVFAGAGQTWRTTRALATEMVAFLAILALIGGHGLWGVVIACSVAAVAGSAVGLIQFKRMASVGWEELLLTKWLDFAALRRHQPVREDLSIAA